MERGGNEVRGKNEGNCKKMERRCGGEGGLRVMRPYGGIFLPLSCDGVMRGGRQRRR